MAAGISAAAWLAAGTALAGAGASVYAGNQAAGAAKRGTNAAIAEQQRQFDAAMQQQRPWAVTGTGALNQLAQLYGLPYAPYQAPGSTFGGAQFNPGGVSAGGPSNTPQWADPANVGVNIFDPLGGAGGGNATWYDPMGFSNGGILGGRQEPNYAWDPKRGVVDVNGRSGGTAGGYINPQTGEVWVATPGTKNRDAALSDAATNYLRTGEGTLDPALSRFGSAIGAMNANGYKYTAPTMGTNADGSPNAQGITTPSGPDMSVFYASPDYQFRRDEGMRGLERSAAARGGAFSGNALRGLADFNSGLASGEFGNFVNRRETLAGLGQSASNNSSQMFMNNGANISNLLNQQGQQRASGIMNTANNVMGSINNGLSLWSYFNQPQQRRV